MKDRPKTADDHEVRSVKSAERVLDILSLLAQYPNGLKLRDIAAELSVPISSLHAILNTMKRRGFVEREAGSMFYRLSRNVHQLISATPLEDDLVSLALPVMEAVQRDSGETVSLSVLVGNEIVFIAKRSSASVLQVVNPLGSRLPAHASGSGKVMLAYLPDGEIDRLYPQEALTIYTPNTINSKSALREALKDVRSSGYSYDNEESILGVWAVAACIHAQDGSPVGATSIVVPAFRVTEARTNGWRDLILAGAAEISRYLGAAAQKDRPGYPKQAVRNGIRERNGQG